MDRPQAALLPGLWPRPGSSSIFPNLALPGHTAPALKLPTAPSMCRTNTQKLVPALEEAAVQGRLGESSLRKNVFLSHLRCPRTLKDVKGRRSYRPVLLPLPLQAPPRSTISRPELALFLLLFPAGLSLGCPLV